MSRDHVLYKVRTALGRSAGQPPADLPACRLDEPRASPLQYYAQFAASLEALTGRVFRADSRESACRYAEQVVGGRRAVASGAALLHECGITSLAGVESGFSDEPSLRRACAVADVGITSARYALADTGTLVMLAASDEARMISLLPPVHLAVVSSASMLSGLDELLEILPDPGAVSSSMVLITGPSRTADIEMILVRGVHGPGEIHVVVV